jgi:hypothetical protein
MAEYRTRVTISPLGLVVSWQNCLPETSPVSLWDWQYQFQDGSCLRGQCLPMVSPHSQTILLAWQKSDFAIFEIDPEKLIIASSDNFVSNSLSVVACPERSCVQVTHWGSKLVSEPFSPCSWTMAPRSQEMAQCQMNWLFSPFFPFIGYQWQWTPPAPPRSPAPVQESARDLLPC